MKKSVFANLFPLQNEEEAQLPEEVPVKKQFSVPPQAFTPVQTGNDPASAQGIIPPSQTEPTFANGSPMIQEPDNVFVSEPQIAPQTQPAPPTNTAMPVINEPTAYQTAQRDYEVAQNKFRNAKNEDKGLKGGLLEGIQNFLYSMGEAYRQNPRANWKQVLAGGAIGTGLGFVDRTWNERRKYEEEAQKALGRYQIAANQAKFDSDMKTAETNRQNVVTDNKRAEDQFLMREQNRFLLEQRRFENRMQQLDKKAELDGRKWKRRVDAEGKVWMDYQNGDSKPFMNPENPSEQDIDPNYKLYEIYSPLSGTKVKIKGAELYRGESQINTTNTNIANSGLSDQQNYDTKVSKLNGDIAASTSKISSLETDLGKLSNAQYDDEIKKRDSIEKELRDEKAKLSGLQTELKNLPKPAQRKTVNAGGRYSGQIFPSPKALKSAFPNNTEAEIRQIIEANGGKFQD